MVQRLRVDANNSSVICHVRLNSRERDGCELEIPCEHLQRLRIQMTDETRMQPNEKYLECVAYQLRLTGAKTRPTPGVLKHPATMDATPLLTTDDTRLYQSCVGALMYYVLDRADAQLEGRIRGSSLRAPTTGAMEALRRATRYLLGTQDAYVKRRIQCADPVSMELVGYSGSDWAGDPSSRKSQSSGHVEADGCPLTSFSRRQNCVATSSGMAEYYAMCSVDSGTFRVETRPFFAILWLRKTLRNVLDR